MSISSTLALFALAHFVPSLETTIQDLDDRPTSGTANVYGICLKNENIGYFFDIHGKKAIRIENRERIVFFEAFLHGFCLNKQLFSFDGTRQAKKLPFMPWGINPLAHGAGVAPNQHGRQVAAFFNPTGYTQTVGPTYLESDFADYESARTASKGWDITNDGTYVFTALVPGRTEGAPPTLTPMIGVRGTYQPLAMPASHTAAYPLKFGYDGSILGEAYTGSTLLATGWADGGLSEPTKSDAILWRRYRPIILTTVRLKKKKGLKAIALDSSGDAILGHAAFPGEANQGAHGTPVIWYRGNCFTVTDLVGKKDVTVTYLLGFTGEKTFAAIGTQQDKSVLILFRIQNESRPMFPQ